MYDKGKYIREGDVGLSGLLSCEMFEFAERRRFASEVLMDAGAIARCLLLPAFGPMMMIMDAVMMRK